MGFEALPHAEASAHVCVTHTDTGRSQQASHAAGVL